MGKKKRSRDRTARRTGLERHQGHLVATYGKAASVDCCEAREAAQFCIDNMTRPAIKNAGLQFGKVAKLATGNMPPTADNSAPVIELARENGWQGMGSGPQ